ncbi:beta-glucosidase [Nocardioides agariphilus]|jgi:beta-glucosidase|uniref:Beta-glucosidase n=1 Tax=Nocardioides agariphilus TaxID=433664 RepID=A0A930YJJ1_9ACTN|nr:GH1 family beta-glucosidase [Nocardioides agariphilus]MBF4769228.1 beta-glucosidase [Nocardioides agariphilus]
MTQTQPTTALTDAVAFPPGFVWGAATAAYQIEGAAAEDGRRPSIWDTFSHTPGMVANGDHGDVACDHYHRMPEDVALMAELGLASYRFSVSWARVRPDGGPVNAAGLAFYDRLVDELLGHGIAPWLTLYHWDLPQVLEDRGGWTVRDTAYRFADYAESVYDVLGDRVPTWTTLNEPWCSAFLGYTSGDHAPGRQEGAIGLVAAHHLLLGHGLALDALRGRDDVRWGISLNCTVADPVSDEAVHLDAARRIDGLHNRLFLDAVLRGHYPADVIEDTAHLGWYHAVHDGDLALISAPIDVLGLNYYHGDAVSGSPTNRQATNHHGLEVPRGVSPFPSAEHVTVVPRDLPRTAMDWEVQPDGLRRLLVRVHDDYSPPPIYVTETGAAYVDRLVDGRVEDPDRLAFLDSYLRAVHDAIAQGVDVGGVFAWSFLDNFEWAYGYDKRFGLVHVDYETQRRTPKSSGLWYAQVARTNVVSTSPTDGPPLP